jgi:hypothetical protein
MEINTIGDKHNVTLRCNIDIEIFQLIIMQGVIHIETRGM